MHKRSILLLGTAGFLLGSSWLLWYLRQTPAEPEPITLLLPAETDRQAFLAQQGFSECRCTGTELVQFPAVPDAIYAPYAALQEAQRLPLTECYGESGTCYSYAPAEDAASTQCIQLLLDDTGRLIGAMLYDAADPATLEPIL